MVPGHMYKLGICVCTWRHGLIQAQGTEKPLKGGVDAAQCVFSMDAPILCSHLHASSH